ncbi:hypothetical protein CPJCM30710_10830 [Clostridium polyendosporum]|uniref:Uncharacterized protein n=1 Tax=Clostridium polyendosporum TaxID=69208 RepID=A0A919RY44_9CLOT|nr:DUF2922 domain-containing protein [Clostridium polyendosporum]GIM28417.1 hypothetical protein CPJCM30710_10830 [Clostridium polyendosporum]
MCTTGVKNDIPQAEVSSLMNIIIAKDIFLTKGGTLISKYSAQLTQRQTTKFDVQ